MLFGWISLSWITWVFIGVAITVVWSSNLVIVSDFCFSGNNLHFPIIIEHFIGLFWSKNLKYGADPYATVEASADIYNSFGVSLQNSCHLRILILLNSFIFPFQSNHKFSNWLGIGISKSNFNNQRSWMMGFDLNAFVSF